MVADVEEYGLRAALADHLHGGRQGGLAIDDRLVDALTDIWVRVIYVDP